ncbi:MAG TPA: ABC transporter ATP-binding protein [bacterium]|nr:ABC transporter ATP-binding protein [bacterium]
MTERVIQAVNLRHAYGKTEALRGASFSVPEGSVTGLLGPNGSGKTTAIHILIGILRRTAGDVSVLGMDPEAGAVAIRRRLGFVPEDPHGEPRFTVAKQLRFLKAFYPSWDDALEARMLDQLDLDPAKKVPGLSRGERSKLALVGALAHRPELLILDDPTLGLDPMARREFIEGMIAVLADEGKTVFFSTHHMQDIEKVADRVIMLNHGETILENDLEVIRDTWRCFQLTFEDGSAPATVSVPGMFRWEPEGRTGRLVFENYTPDAMKIMEEIASSVDAVPFDLEDIFVENASRGRRRRS